MQRALRRSSQTHYTTYRDIGTLAGSHCLIEILTCSTGTVTYYVFAQTVSYYYSKISCCAWPDDRDLRRMWKVSMGSAKTCPCQPLLGRCGHRYTHPTGNNQAVIPPPELEATSTARQRSDGNKYRSNPKKYRTCNNQNVRFVPHWCIADIFGDILCGWITSVLVLSILLACLT